MLDKLRQPRWILRLAAILACAWAATTAVRGEDWPAFRNKDGNAVWNETGIVEKFPATGLKYEWRTPTRMGYGGPSVVAGRLYFTDFEYTTRPRGTERALALDEKTGKILWTQQWEANYSGVQYDHGPRATPLVDGDLVYLQGAVGALLCLNNKTGEVLWKKDLVAEYRPALERSSTGGYGFVAPPLLDGNKVIPKVGGEPNAMIVAFDKRTGKELWKSLPAYDGFGESALMIATGAKTRQLIVWHTAGIASLDPETGKIYWEFPWKPERSTVVGTPLQAGNLLFFAAYYHGSQAFILDEDKPGIHSLWKSKSESETVTDAIQPMFSTASIVGDYVYGIDSHGEFRCLDLKTGDRRWMTQAVTTERALHGNAHVVYNKPSDRFFITNDFGELIIVKPDPDRYNEISRTQLIAPTTPASQRRRGGKISWTYPAFADKHIFTRNDEEIVSASLAAEDYK